MKKSSSVTLTLLASAAMLVTSGCRSKPEVRNCIDQTDHIVDDFNCDPSRRSYGPSPYRWRFGGSSGGHIGDTVFGGSSTPSSGSHVAGSVSRGGFGSTHASSAS